MTGDQTIDFVIGFLSIGLVVLGLGSIALGKLVHAYDRWRGVNRFQESEIDDNDQTAQTDQTDQTDGRVSVGDRWMERMQLDRSKTALIELLVYSGWDVGQIRANLKGDNGVLGTEIEAARKRLGIAPPAPTVTPIVGRPTEARFPNN